MRAFKIFIHVLLLVTMPSFLVYPHDITTNRTILSKIVDETQTEIGNEFSYDQIIQLFETIESGDLEKECDFEELEKIKHFIVFLAKEGVLQDNFEESVSLNEDAEELLNANDDAFENMFSLGNLTKHKYIIMPAVINGYGEVILCKNWFKKQWHHVKKFAKKHKKALIIGAAIVAAVTVVVAVVAVSAAAAGTAAAASAGGTAGATSAGTDKSSKTYRKEEICSSNETTSSLIEVTQKAPNLKDVMDDQISVFKDNVVTEQFFEFSNQEQIFSLEDNGRTFGSLLAHACLNDISKQIPYNPHLTQEIQNLSSNLFLISLVNNKDVSDPGHVEIDKNFSTNYAYLCSDQGKEIDFKALSYQVRGEKALEYGYYDRAIQDLGKAIEINPSSPIPYLKKGMAHFGLGQYDLSLEDYHQFTMQSQQSQKADPLSVPEFSLGFARGIPKGIYDSGSGLFLFISDLVKHPINTGKQMWEALTVISDLARSEEWDTLSESLVPEIHQLVKQWDSLSSDKRGELAGYAFGKYGSDIVIPGALAKAVSNGIKGAHELSAVCKGLQTAEQTLVLESIADLGNGAKIGEAVRASQTTLALGEEVGLNVSEIVQLKQTGKLQEVINTGLDKLVFQSESEVLKTAISQNKHIKMVKDYLDKPAKEIQKGVNSYEKQISIHKDKITNPTKYYPDWYKLDPRQREALINKKWPAEIKGYEEQKSILQSILNERLSYER